MKDLYFTSFWMDMLKGYSYFLRWIESAKKVLIIYKKCKCTFNQGFA